MQQLNDLIRPEEGLTLLTGLSGGVDLSKYPLDGPFPDLRKTEGWVSRAQMMVGPPTQIADQLQSWFENGAADGFNVLPPVLPASLDEFVDLVIPELQRRGLFRTAYEGRTLRENLGLARPQNQHLLQPKRAKAA